MFIHLVFFKLIWLLGGSNVLLTAGVCNALFRWQPGCLVDLRYWGMRFQHSPTASGLASVARGSTDRTAFYLSFV